MRRAKLRSTSLVASFVDACRAAAAQAATAVGAACRSVSPRSSSRSRSGAVTITPRSCVSASRRTSTALRRATSSSRSASRRSPDRGNASVSLASAARAVRAASSVSSLPPSRLSARGARADLEHRLATSREEAGKAGAVAACALDRPGAPARRIALDEAKRFPVAARVGRERLPSHDRTGLLSSARPARAGSRWVSTPIT